MSPFRIHIFLILLLVVKSAAMAAINEPAGEGDPIAGTQLAERLRQMVPSTNASWSGTMVKKMRDYTRVKRPVSCQIFVEPGKWSAIYTGRATDDAPAEKLTVVHHDKGTVDYFYWIAQSGDQFVGVPKKLQDDDTMISFAGSDFYLSDFGMEFFQWPTQLLQKGQMKRGQPCYVLDSISPRPDGNGYFRVRSWVEKKHLGLMQANAYNENGKLLKEFRTGSFKKDDLGNYQLKDMEITDRKSGTETQLKFDLDH